MPKCANGYSKSRSLERVAYVYAYVYIYIHTFDSLSLPLHVYVYIVIYASLELLKPCQRKRSSAGTKYVPTDCYEGFGYRQLIGLQWTPTTWHPPFLLDPRMPQIVSKRRGGGYCCCSMGPVRFAKQIIDRFVQVRQRTLSSWLQGHLP